MATDTLFKAKAPWLMRKLMSDFDLSVVEAAAIVGNLGHESGGFRQMQEMQPMVAGSRGGWGIAQWTGPRRRDAEAYWKRNNLDPNSIDDQYKWLFVELKGPEKAAIPAVKRAGSLRDKVIAFEAAFERAGVKHYPSRVAWAEKALAAYNTAPGPAPKPAPIPTPSDVPPPVLKPPAKPAAGVGVGAALGALITAIAAAAAKWFGWI